MDKDELEIKRFQLEQEVKIGELDLKRKELDLKIQEQKSKTFATPLVLSVIGAALTIITGIVLKFFESRATNLLEDRKFQSTLLLKAAEAKNYDEFSAMLLVFQRNGLLQLDSSKIYDFRKQKFVAEKLDKTESSLVKNGRIDNVNQPVWVIVTGTNANLADARSAIQMNKSKGFSKIEILRKGERFMNFHGRYNSYETAVSELFDVKEKINKSSYIARFDVWCAGAKFDTLQQVYYCK